MYNKIFAKILDSSIWLESDAVRIVWVTCLAAMDEDGMCVFASPANLAHRANVTLTACLAALEVLEGPDPNSSDPEHDGRRLERVPGGWMVLNAGKYREIVTREIAMAANRRRVARHREKRASGNGSVTVANDSVTISVSESYTGSRSGSETHTHARAAPEPVSVRSPQTSEDVPVVKGSGRNVGRLFLHRWQFDALIDTLGPLAEGFVLDEWIQGLNDSLAGKALPRNAWKWVQEQLHAEIARRNLPRVETRPTNGTPVNEPGDCPHTPQCDAPGRWECWRKSQIAALKGAGVIQ